MAAVFNFPFCTLIPIEQLQYMLIPYDCFYWESIFICLKICSSVGSAFSYRSLKYQFYCSVKLFPLYTFDVGAKLRLLVKRSKVSLFKCLFTQSNNFPYWVRLESTIPDKIIEASSSFHMKYTVKDQFLFLGSFLLVLTKLLFWREDWSLG